MALLFNGAEHLIAQDMTVPSLPARCGLGDSRSLWTAKLVRRKLLLTKQEDEVMDSLDKLNIYKLEELDGKQPSTLEADQCPCEATFCQL